MDNYFETILLESILKTEGYYINKLRNGFSKLYPFTTENINGYINQFKLKNKSLLTIGSSADQLINAILSDCKDITLLDICPFTKFYFYLKASAIKTLEYNDFFKFFCYKDYPKFCKDNKETFNLESFNLLKPTLRLLDYESYLFWDELLTPYQGIDIRKELFSQDEYMVKNLQHINPYLTNQNQFYITKEKITKVTPTFIIDNIFDINLTRNYDNIWLSNLAAYHPLTETKNLIDKLLPHLNNNGKILLAYLYKTVNSTKYQEDWSEIYNLDKVLEIFKDNYLELISFEGIRKNIDDKDSILLYKKKTK